MIGLTEGRQESLGEFCAEETQKSYDFQWLGQVYI
jgi:hypothetical protein